MVPWYIRIQWTSVASGMDAHRDASAIGGQKLTALEPAEALVWEMHETIDR